MLQVTCPFDGELLKELPQHEASQAEKMLDTANQLLADQSQWLEHHQRIEILKNLAKLVQAEFDDFAMLIASEGGKPLIDAKVEVARAIDGIELAAKAISKTFTGEEIPMAMTVATVGRKAHTIIEPIGVVLALSAFNHPLNLIVHQVIPAVAVGCPVIVKPASATPLCCIRVCELLKEAGLPDGWCQYILCSNQVAEQLSTSPRINFMTFIGSARVGWYLKSKLAPGVRSAFEHGGVAPVIVHETADIDAMIPALAKGGFYHAGQVCVSVQRVYVPRASAEQVATKLAEAAKKLKVGDARLPDTEVGPLINHGEVERVDEWVNEAIAAGAKAFCGADKITESTYAPTVLLDPPEDVTISMNEVFGPVVCIYSYDDVADAVKRANGLDVAFQSAVFGKDLDAVYEIARHLDASAVMINDHTAFRADWMPFAGRRASGYGIGGIGYTMHDMVQHKMIVHKYL